MSTTTDKTAEEQFLDLDGWDEIAIKRSFGTSIEDLRETPFPFLRALVFADQRKASGLTDADAYTFAMGLSVRQLDAYFAEESETEKLAAELGEPATEAGKDDELPRHAQL